MSRSVLIAANWKLNPNTLKGSQELASGVSEGIKDKKSTKVEVAFCVPAIYLQAVESIIAKSPIKLGGQNLYSEEKGAFTGEISAPMLTDIGAKYVVLGHSERRTLFAETDELISKKAQVSLKHNLIPIVCVGETLEQREKNETDSVIISQLNKSLKSVETNGDNLVIAYEPVWAIGTGKTCSSEEANRVCGLIRQELAKLYSKEIAEKVLILYGGSVKSNTIKEQMQQSEIDGALVGGASLIVDEFVQLVLNAG